MNIIRRSVQRSKMLFASRGSRPLRLGFNLYAYISESDLAIGLTLSSGIFIFILRGNICLDSDANVIIDECYFPEMYIDQCALCS